MIKGEWIVDGHHIRCSECGVFFVIRIEKEIVFQEIFVPIAEQG